MSSAVSDADYVCTLNEKSAKKAKDELNEDPKNRLGAVEKFRELVLQQPHIKCPTGIQPAQCWLTRKLAIYVSSTLTASTLVFYALTVSWFEDTRTIK